MLECVVNVSEGRDSTVLEALARSARPWLLDVHADAHHNRAVLTLGGPAREVEAGTRSLAREAVERIDISLHHGAHPRIGALDVVPFVSLAGWPLLDASPSVALEARDRFAAWAAETLGLPCFLYGAARSLPEVRRGAWRALAPDAGPLRPHPSAGAVAVGARPALVAYNLWLDDPDLELARRVAAELRGPLVRTLGLAVGSSVQVSCNLVAPWSHGPAAVFDAVSSRAPVERAELVGLIPASVLNGVPRGRWKQLDLSEEKTIEARLEEAGLDGGRAGA